MNTQSKPQIKEPLHNFTISSAKYIKNDGYPALELMIEGKRANICQVNKGLLQDGIVPLGDREINWSQLVQVTIIENGKEKILQSCTSDPKIVALALKLWNAINKKEGERFVEGETVDIPN